MTNKESAALEKPLNEKRQTAKDIMRWEDVVLWMDVVAAVQKHRKRDFFPADPGPYTECAICGVEVDVVCDEAHGFICYHCACDIDFGKVKP